MHELTANEKQKLLDRLGKRVIEHVRDVSLEIGMDIAQGTTVNPIKKDQYSKLANLSDDEKEMVCDLISETITDTIYNFLSMLEAHSNEMRFVVLNGDAEYDLRDISEDLGSEITFQDEDGWIQKFSKIGRNIL